MFRVEFLCAVRTCRLFYKLRGGLAGLARPTSITVLGVDQFLGMGRSATNVVGNAVAAGVIAKWEQAPH